VTDGIMDMLIRDSEFRELLMRKLKIEVGVNGASI
jgi:hypothetical protein